MFKCEKCGHVTPDVAVHVTAGDYEYDGVVVVSFVKTSGKPRLAVEDEHGRLFFHNPSQVTPWTAPTE